MFPYIQTVGQQSLDNVNPAFVLSEGPTVALSQIRQLYWESTDNTYEEQLNAERWAQRTAGRADDFVEGVSAFLGKRKAEFKGK
jgi:2-(1,2-epoxy-1,2-dihydrophenyl)acetyl-CoA isomerase